MAKVVGKHGELFSRLCDPEHLIDCARDAARGKRRRPDVAAFLLDMEPLCFDLAEELQRGEWRPSGYRTFHIQYPKPRQISSAPFADRVVHHAIVSILEPYFERRFVPFSFACRVGKGTHAALARASSLSARRRYVLRGDVTKFFPSIDHAILKAQVRRVIGDERMLVLLDLVIDGSNAQEPVLDWFPGDDLMTPALRRRGIPIGNLTSQFLANVLLDVLDHEVMDRLGFGDYVRYCDDFLVFSDDAAALHHARTAIDGCLSRLRLRLHERKGGIHSTRAPFPFCGFVLRRGVRRLKRESLVRATRRLRGLRRAVEAGTADSKSVSPRIAAWKGHARHVSSPRLVALTLLRAGYTLLGVDPITIRTVCCAAAAGTTTPTTVARRIATTTTPITPTTISGSVSPVPRSRAVCADGAAG